MLIDTIHHIILGFSFVDITLTYFFFYLQETKISNDYREEMNPIARNILKLKLSMPLKYLLMLAFAYAYITFIAVFIVKIDSEAVFYLYCTIYGMYLIVLWTHIYNITYYLKNWKNKEYWKKLEELKSIS